ncbi:MAG: SPOR domain-containing protein [Ignavibacteriaceae bacterium]
MRKSKIIFTVLAISLLSIELFAQETNIVPYLKQVEMGNKQVVIDEMPDLKKDHPNDPSILFLEGVVTENGQNAMVLYKDLINKYPKSKYADAAIYRIYSYYYALGLYQTAKTYIEMLKKNYPGSAYLDAAERKMPAKDEVSNEDKVVKEQPPVKKEEPPKTEKKNLEYKFTIQAGAFSNTDNAIALMKRFEDAGFYSEVKEKNVAGTSFHIVFIGKFLTEDEAKNFLDVINTRFSLDGRVVPIVE